MPAPHILRLDASMRKNGSASRELVDHLVFGLQNASPGASVVTRDLAKGIDFVSEEWIVANFTDPAERSARQRDTLGLSDACVAELKAADIIVIGLPIYNFGVPAAFKAWIDFVCRARETFAYSEHGPKGLLENKQAYVVMVSGGTDIGGPADFASAYVRHVLGFIGITEVKFIAAGRLVFECDERIAAAKNEIDGLLRS